MYTAILFDMDGVLLDSEPLFLKAINDNLSEYGVDIISSLLYTSDAADE